MVRTRDIIRASLPCDKKKLLCENYKCKICFNKSFESVIPNTLKLLNTDARDVGKHSQKIGLFKCLTCLHTFNKKFCSITKGEQCIYCTSKPVKLCDIDSCKFCFNKSIASHKKSECWNYEKNTLTPRQVFINSTEKYHFTCDVCAHDFETSPKAINKTGSFCPFCCNIKLCGELSCNFCRPKSFVMHQFAESWSAKNIVHPWQVFRCTEQKFLFDCKKCNHELNVAPYGARENKLNCEYCASKKMCNDDNCKLCFDKSFASNSFSKYWSKKNKVKPIDVFGGTPNKYIFDCPKCKHEFETTPARINENKANCVYCASLLLCKDNNCKYCFDKSFASQEKAKFWSTLNKVKPRDVFKCTEFKYYFDCNLCNKPFKISLSSVKACCWCTCSKNKTEKKLLKWLNEKYGETNIIYQLAKIVDNKKYFYDFYVNNLNLIIELDGLQHFEQVGKWKSPEHNFANDIKKINLAIKDNKSIIHVLQEDVLYDKNDWDNKLSKCIVQYEKPTCVFIDNDKIYSQHLKTIKVKNVILT
jgi:hypothetical protein